jgi:hypothetical protein
MYRKSNSQSVLPENFVLPFEGKLSEDNRWVIMASLIPWEEFEEEYAAKFSTEKGAPAKPFRMALGALIIHEKLRTSDRETVEQIKENPYLQYFLGLLSYSNEAPFDASMLVHFRQRISLDFINRVNERMVMKVEEMLNSPEEVKKPDEEVKTEAETEVKTEVKTEAEAEVKTEASESKNQGKLILDATCAPADIHYPTDLEILNEAREKTEEIIDFLYELIKAQLDEKPRTYREKARKDFLDVSKKRRPSGKQRKKAIKKQLQYIKRNLGHIDQLIAAGASLSSLSTRQYKMLLVVAEAYRQQLWMYENKQQRIDDRIVSLSQPHVRPIVRGKAGRPVEFGAKLSASYINGYVFLDKLSWNNFNESGDLKEQIEDFKRSRGCYPESVHVDKIYRTKENRKYCKERGIRMSGPPLGRPPVNISKEKKKQARQDENFRNAIEGKFGQAKRRFSLSRVMAKLSSTAETAIAVTFLVINLSTLLRQTFCLFLYFFQERAYFSPFPASVISKDYVSANFADFNLSFKLA